MDGEKKWKTLLKWMIWGYHYVRKHPCLESVSLRFGKVSGTPGSGGNVPPAPGNFFLGDVATLT